MTKNYIRNSSDGSEREREVCVCVCGGGGGAAQRKTNQ